MNSISLCATWLDPLSVDSLSAAVLGIKRSAAIMASWDWLFFAAVSCLASTCQAGRVEYELVLIISAAVVSVMEM